MRHLNGNKFHWVRHQARCKHEATLPPSRQHSSAGMQSIAKHLTASYMMCKPDHMSRTSRSNGAVQHRALSRFPNENPVI